ncbi:MAG: MBL fold metallo-hydrolase [Burkholderiaceae bacterium]|nr:MBL fold metallo-hydrolase [Burkholderiaceae bacterium]
MQAARRPFASPLLTLAVAVFIGFASLAHAEAPPVQTQVPGYYRTMVGQHEVTALFDGAMQMDVQRLTHARQEDIQKLLARMFVGTHKMQTAVNAYLINTGKHLVLVDAGCGTLYGPQLGHVLANLQAAGYQPEQVDTVVITHLHGDHIAGLIGMNRQPAFLNATVYVDKTESDYWLSDKIAAAAPASWQRIFASAKTAAEPYLQRSQWKTFSAGTPIVPGITPVAAPGHTPGHTAFAVESEGARLLIWGDLVHSHAVQFARPDVAFNFDVDPKQAIATRLAIFRAVAESGELVAGMHLPFPGIGHVRAEGRGIYSWVPVEYTPMK